jgi:RNA polymerase sigma-70 factor (ECF subfamily)
MGGLPAASPFLSPCVDLDGGSSDVNETEASVEQAAPGTPSPEFVQLFTHYQRRLFLYILSQIPNPIEAEEVQQETNVVIWSKFAQFRQGTNFLAWVSQIANFEVMKYRSRKKRDRMQFSDEFLETVSREALERSDELEDRQKALVECIEKLRPRDRELIQQRYAPGEKGKHLAEQIGRPANSVYQSLGRIRRSLMECIQRRLMTRGTP